MSKLAWSVAFWYTYVGNDPVNFVDPAASLYKVTGRYSSVVRSMLLLAISPVRLVTAKTATTSSRLLRGLRLATFQGQTHSADEDGFAAIIHAGVTLSGFAAPCPEEGTPFLGGRHRFRSTITRLFAKQSQGLREGFLLILEISRRNHLVQELFVF